MFLAIAWAMGGVPRGVEGIEGIFSSLLPLILLFVILCFLLIRPQQKKAKEYKQMLEDLKKEGKVITSECKDKNKP